MPARGGTTLNRGLDLPEAKWYSYRMRCLLVSPYLLYMQVLSSVLRRASGISEIRVALSPMAALNECLCCRPDILIADTFDGGGKSSDSGGWLREIGGKTHLILLVDTALDVPFGAESLPNVHVLSKRQAFDELAGLLRGLLPWSSKEVKLPLHARIQDLLSSRQMEIFLLIGEGLTSRQISKRLGISVQTVGAHRKHIAEKLGTVGSELTQAATACYWNAKANGETLFDLSELHRSFSR